MPRDVLTPEIVADLLQAADIINKARIFQGNTQAPFNIQSMTLDLSSARLETNPLPIKFPFKSVYVASADQLASVVYLKPQTQDSYQSAVPLRPGDTLDFGSPVASAYLYWDVLPLGVNNTMTLIFFLDASVNSSRSLIHQASYGMFSHFVISLDAETVTELTSDWYEWGGANPRKFTIYNDTGADLFVGGASVRATGSTKGLTIPAGGYFEHTNLQALYGWSVAGGNVTIMMQA